MKHLWMLFVCLVLALPATAAPPDLDRTLPVDGRVRITTLENGLTVYLRENRKPENRVELRLVVNAGSILEREDEQGLAHFVEHMAFNGTTRFEANDLISFLESIGARFGPDLNAYTSFDETVYMLEIPTDKEGLLEQGVVVLSEWAHAMTMVDEEVEKERGVVLEEWRLGQGAEQRLRRIHWPVLLEGSQYAVRLPIGKPEIIEGAPPGTLRGFYRRWYRPDLMAVIAVGDFDSGEMESLVRKHFSEIPAVSDPVPRPEYDVPSHSQVRTSSATDKEMPATYVVLYFKHPRAERGTVGAYRRGLITTLFSSMLGARLNEITEKPDAPLLGAGSGAGSPFRTIDMFRVYGIAKEGMTGESLATLVTEINRIRGHGWGQGELDRAQARLLASLERAYNERDKTESAVYAAEYARNFLDEEPIPGIEAEFALAQELLAGITLEDVNGAIDRLVHTDNQVILASGTEKEGVPPLPDAAALAAIATEAAAVTPGPYEDLATSSTLLAELPPPGEIVARGRVEELGITVLEFENGVEAWFKPTDFKDDEVLFAARIRGGTSLADSADYPSASIAAALVEEGGLGEFTPTDLSKLLSGKDLSVSPEVSTFSHGISGRSSPQDLETALQLVHLYFTAPNERPEAFEVLMEMYRNIVAHRTASPETRFSDRLREINYSGSYLFAPPSLEMLERIDRETALAFYRRLFVDASQFRFYFVGSFDPETIEPWVARYLGSLPVTEDNAVPAYRDPGLRFPPRTTETEVRAGTEPKSRTRITWPALTGLDEMEMFRLRKANDIVEIRLREKMREELGSTYSVGVSYSILLPYPDYGTTGVGYGSSPRNAERLVATVLEVVERFKTEGPTEEELATVKELELRAVEKGLEQNQYWLSSFTTLDLLGWDLRRVLDRKSRIETLTRENLRETFARYYPEDHYTVVKLMPETDDGGEKGSGSR